MEKQILRRTFIVYVKKNKKQKKRESEKSNSILFSTLRYVAIMRWNFLLVARCLLLFTRCSLLLARCSLLSACYSLLFARFSLLFARCSLLFACFSLLFVSCSTRNSEGCFLSKSEQKFIHINLYKKFNLWMTWKLR